MMCYLIILSNAKQMFERMYTPKWLKKKSKGPVTELSRRKYYYIVHVPGDTGYTLRFIYIILLLVPRSAYIQISSLENVKTKLYCPIFSENWRARFKNYITGDMPSMTP